MKAPVIFTGFRHSGNTLAAQHFQRQGIPYALDPIGYDFSQPGSYLEDKEAIRLHDRLLKEAGSDWMYSNESLFVSPSNSVIELQKYVEARHRVSGDIWLMTDPRATLFLDDWRQALGQNGRFVLLYRHWSSCIETFFKKSAEEMAWFLPSNQKLNDAMKVWKDPASIARVWLAYNRHLIEFAEKQPDICLVVSQHELMQGVSVASLFQDKFHCPMINDIQSDLDKHYVEPAVSSDIVDMLPHELIYQLDYVFEHIEKLNFSGHRFSKSTAEKTNPPSHLIQLIVDQISSANSSDSRSSIAGLIDWYDKDPSVLNNERVHWSNKAVDDYYNNIREGLSRSILNKFFSNLATKQLSDRSIGLLSGWILKAYLKIFSITEVLSLLVPVSGKAPAKPSVSVVITSQNMERELSRTLLSLKAPYQREMSLNDIEIILIDTGSVKEPSPDDYPDIPYLRVVSLPKDSYSHAQALNLGINLAAADIIGVFSDSTRMASPGLIRNVLIACRTSDYAIVDTAGYHLGPEVQIESVLKGYNQAVEDRLLDQINWSTDGYQLFKISSYSGFSSNIGFNPFVDSNSLFISRSLLQKIGGADENCVFSTGSFAILDLYKRAYADSSSELFVLENEGTFRQLNDEVVSTISTHAPLKSFQDDYFTITGTSFSFPTIKASIMSQHHPCESNCSDIIENKVKDGINGDLHNQEVLIDRIILDSTWCQVFNNQNSCLEEMIDSPVIITGRGGSGTRLLSKLMQDINLFIGNDINKTEDSLEWVGPIYDLVINRIQLNNDTFSELHIQRLRNNARNILQRANYNAGLWGFKLPEAILCLPELKKAFPNARFLHLTRHPVSLSMRNVHITSRFNHPVGKTVLEDGYRFIGKNDISLLESTHEINNAISWNYQIAQAIIFFSKLESGKEYLQIKYEDIVSGPDQVLASICQFLDIANDSKSRLDIDLKRVNSISESTPVTENIWSICESTANQIGYKPLAVE